MLAEGACALALAETREAGRERREIGQVLVRVQLLGARQQGGFRLLVVRIGHAALDRANRLALLGVGEANALTATRRIDDVFAVALTDGVVRALGLAST